MNIPQHGKGRFMSNEPLGNTTRRGFLGTATAATALTLTAPPAAEAQTAVRSADEIKMAQLTAASHSAAGSDRYGRLDEAGGHGDPERGILQTRARPLWSGVSKTPANYGFTIIAKVKPGREQAIREHGKTIEKAVAENPYCSCTAQAALPAMGPL